MSIVHNLTLDARENYPLARALVFYRGDSLSSVLKLKFTDGETPIGEETGCSATLQILFDGAQEARVYLLTKDRDAGYSIRMSAPMLSCSGVVRCTASLFDQNNLRLTVGRFTYTVLDDDSLTAQPDLSEAQVSLMQQALSSIALAYDRVDEIQSILGGDQSYARQMGDYAKQWGDAAKDVVQDVSVTWYTLPGKPNAFTPALHTHQEFGQLLAAIPDPRRMLLLREAPGDADSAFDAVRSLISDGCLAGFLWASAYQDLPAVSGLLFFFAKATGEFTALFTDGLTLSLRSASLSAWMDDWSQAATPTEEE